MAKKSHKNKKRGTAAPKVGGHVVASEGKVAASAPPAAPPLGSGRVVRSKVKKVSAKEQAALAKKEARARWAERMTAGTG